MRACQGVTRIARLEENSSSVEFARASQFEWLLLLKEGRDNRCGMDYFRLRVLQIILTSFDSTSVKKRGKARSTIFCVDWMLRGVMHTCDVTGYT